MNVRTRAIPYTPRPQKRKHHVRSKVGRRGRGVGRIRAQPSLPDSTFVSDESADPDARNQHGSVYDSMSHKKGISTSRPLHHHEAWDCHLQNTKLAQVKRRAST